MACLAGSRLGLGQLTHGHIGLKQDKVTMADNAIKSLMDIVPDGLLKYFSKIPFSWRVGKSYRKTLKLLERTQQFSKTELVDENGDVIKEPGKTGEIVGTRFVNLAMPLIRYRTDDFGAYAEGGCTCGRKCVRLRNVVGRRNNDYLVTLNNDTVLFSSVETQKSVFSYVYQWQFVQNVPGKVNVNIISNSKITANKIRSMEKELNSQFENRIHFQVAVVENLIRTETGKTKSLLQNIKI